MQTKTGSLKERITGKIVPGKLSKLNLDIKDLKEKLSTTKDASGKQISKIKKNIEKLENEYKQLKRKYITSFLTGAMIFAGSVSGLSYAVLQSEFIKGLLLSNNEEENLDYLNELNKAEKLYEYNKFAEADLLKITNKYGLPEDLSSKIEGKIVYAKYGSSKNLFIIFADQHTDVQIKKMHLNNMNFLTKYMNGNYKIAIEGTHLTDNKKTIKSEGLIIKAYDLENSSAEEKAKFLGVWEPTIDASEYYSVLYGTPVYGVDIDSSKREMLKYESQARLRSVHMYTKSTALLNESNVILTVGASHAVDMSYLLENDDISVLIIDKENKLPINNYPKKLVLGGISYSVEVKKEEVRKNEVGFKVYLYREDKLIWESISNDPQVLNSLRENINKHLNAALQKQENDQLNDFVKDEIISANYNHIVVANALFYQTLNKLQVLLESQKISVPYFFTYHTKVMKDILADKAINNRTIADLLLSSLLQRIQAINGLKSDAIKKGLTEKDLLSQKTIDAIIPHDEDYEVNLLLYKTIIKGKGGDVFNNKQLLKLLFKPVINRKYII